MSEKEILSAAVPGGGRGGRGGRGIRWGGGSRGGARSTSAQGGRGDAKSPGGGHSSGNHGRHPRQQLKPPQQRYEQTRHNRGGKGTGRPRSSSLNEKNDCPPTKSGPYTHLFCSERHTFALSRVLYTRNSDQFLIPTHHRDGRNRDRLASIDQLELWWESVKMVKCHVPFNESMDASSTESNRLSFLERCPICLDEDMVSPFIAPCSHIFCLPCALGYLNSVAKDLNAESERIRKNKPYVKGCVGVVGSTSAMTNSATVTTVRARCPMCSSGSSMELRTGDAMITYKDLRPVVFIPVLSATAGTRMKFVKLHRVKTCPAPYLPLEGRHVRGGYASPTSSLVLDEHLVALPDGDDESDECVYSRQHFVGLREYDTALQRCLEDLKSYRDCSIYSKMDPREALNIAMAIEAVQAAQRRWNGSVDDGGFRGMELEAKSAAVVRKQLTMRLLAKAADEKDDATTNKGAANSGAKCRKNSPLLQPGSFLQNHATSMSSQEESDEYLYYQSYDGQPCYLSCFDLACLRNEFSTGMQFDNASQDEESPQSHLHPESPSLLPLPDELTATVVDVEQLTITTALIKRKPFLSHLPLYSSIKFVEVDWYSGGDRGNQPLLSHRTLTKFQEELQRRRSERQLAHKREQIADKFARAKQEREEQRQKELLRSNFSAEGSCRQTIDPDDDFFRVPATSDQSDEGTRWNRFNEVCATGGVWPELAVEVSPRPVASVSHCPATVPSSSPPRTTNSTWGRRSHSTLPKVVVSSFPSLAESSLSIHEQKSKGSR
ncbi:hypothetical protein ACHAXA_003473 [Cyclostephanos tholiformis]|uniref:RING-type domain-containing protein n=1 Tax=Cyclostephanos tholiformis TaxID=382380 RepID=A0ABD3SF59_9STRA